MDILDVAIAKKLAAAQSVPANLGAANEGKVLAVSGTGAVIPVEGDPSVATAGDVTYSDQATYSDGTVGKELTTQKSEITALGLSVVDGALCQTYTA